MDRYIHLRHHDVTDALILHSCAVKGTSYYTPEHYTSMENKPIGSGAYAV